MELGVPGRGTGPHMPLLWWLTQPKYRATCAGTHMYALPFYLYYDFSIFHMLRQSIPQESGKKIMKIGEVQPSKKPKFKI